MAYDYFVASRYRNRMAVEQLVTRIRDRGKSVYCFVESAASIAQGDPNDAETEDTMRRFEALQRAHPLVREIFEEDMAALRACQNLILLLPAGKSAHIEAGIAYGLGKHLICIGEPQETESLYLIFDETHPSAEEFINSMNRA